MFSFRLKKHTGCSLPSKSCNNVAPIATSEASTATENDFEKSGGTNTGVLANRDFMSGKASWVVLVQEKFVPFLSKSDKTGQRCVVRNVLPVVPEEAKKGLQLFTIAWLWEI